MLDQLGTTLAVNTILIGSLLEFLAGLVYLYVAHNLRQQRLPTPGPRARAMFVLWAVAIGSYHIVSGILAIAPAYFGMGIASYLPLTLLRILFVHCGLWALLYYMIYLFTGQTRQLVPLGAAYAALFTYIVWFVLAGQPTAVGVGPWGAHVLYQSPPAATHATLLFLSFWLPQTVAALAHLTLLATIRDPTKRYRVVLISAGILLWSFSLYLVLPATVPPLPLAQASARVLGVTAAVAILAAYQPPLFVRRRWGVLSMAAEARLATPLHRSVETPAIVGNPHP